MTGLVCAIRMGKHLTERGVGGGRELNGDHLLERMLLGVSDGMGWQDSGGANAKLCEWEKNSGRKCKIENTMLFWGLPAACHRDER